MNGGCYLSEAVNSALSQTYKCNILVVDNGSTDSSIKYLEFYQSTYANFSYIVEQRKSISLALNSGLNLIKTKYIARLDSDDIMSENRIDEQVKKFLDNPNLVLVGSQVNFIDCNNKVLGTSQYPLLDHQIRQKIRYTNPFAHPSVMFKSELVKSLNGYDSSLDGAEDLDLWLKLASFGLLENISDPLTSYRIHDLQTTKLNNYYKIEQKVRTKQLFGALKKVNLIDSLILMVRKLDLLLISSGIQAHRLIFTNFRNRLK